MKHIMSKRLDSTGFRAPAKRPLGQERRSVMLAELVAIIALALSTMVTVTVLTVGIARANVVDGVIGHESSLFGIALLLGLIFIGVGGFAMRPGNRRR